MSATKKIPGKFVGFDAPHYVYEDENGELYYLSSTQMHNSLRDPLLPAGTPVVLTYRQFFTNIYVWCVNPVETSKGF